MQLQELQNQPVVMFLIGLPGSGKSTFRNKLPSSYIILSTDDVFDRLAKEQGLTYTQAFHQLGFTIPQAEFDKAFQDAIQNNKNIVIDQTNMNSKARGKKLRLIPKNYKKIAVIFTVSDDVLQQRLDKRAQATGKIIPSHVLATMKNSYEEPTKAEGFDEIRHINQ